MVSIYLPNASEREETVNPPEGWESEGQIRNGITCQCLGKQTTYFSYDNTGNATVGGLAACSFPFWTAPTKKCLRLVPSSLKKTGPLSPSKAVSGPEIVRKLCRNARRPGPELFKTSSVSRIAS